MRLGEFTARHLRTNLLLSFALTKWHTGHRYEIEADVTQVPENMAPDRRDAF